jgi:hypothetical protein
MPELPPSVLTFPGGCPDCGGRQIALPPPLPVVGDDFDWRVRDYDGFRLAMLEELVARFPERSRWTPGDLEVVLVEVLAAVLDQLSDTLDRVASEAYLETARRPESVRRLLSMIGYDAVTLALARGEIDLKPDEDPPLKKGDSTPRQRLDAFWLANPHAMDEARQAGPRAIHDQHRMVTVDDYARRLEEHPLVLRAHAAESWTGSWTTVRVALMLWENEMLDGKPSPPEKQPPTRSVKSYPDDLWLAIVDFHEERGLRLPVPPVSTSEPPVQPDPPPSIRTFLNLYVEAYRMAGQEVVLGDAVQVPITMSLSVRVAESFYQSEVRHAIGEALGRGPAGFFQPGRLRFGEDLHTSDVIAAVMALDGVVSVCLNRFQRLGGEYPDQVASGRIRLDGLEVALCDNDPQNPANGYFRLTLHGGQKG